MYMYCILVQNYACILFAYNTVSMCIVGFATVYICIAALLQVAHVQCVSMIMYSCVLLAYDTVYIYIVAGQKHMPVYYELIVLYSCAL